MNEYICSYFIPPDSSTYYFKCYAEDEDHATEQLKDAEPLAESIFCEINSVGEKP